MIQARDLTKTYGRNPILHGASLAVRRGECVVLTGDNGSGKTTLLHILVGLRRPDSGQVIWQGQNLTKAGPRIWRQARTAWGFLPQNVALPPHTPVGQLLRFHARLRGTGIESARRWLDRVGLAHTRRQHVNELSGGMQQRLGIALTLFFNPQLIVMDEPASSLDPGWRGALAQWAAEQADRGAAVLVTSQLHESWGPNTRYCHCEAGRIDEKQPAMEMSR